MINKWRMISCSVLNINNVCIGMYSAILGGVTIGDGSIIAAGSVVTKDVPENVMAGCVTVRVIKSRYNNMILATT